MKLPNAERAVVEEVKITRYLLSLDNIDGRPKAVFFLRFGFSPLAWEEMAVALVRHGNEYEIERTARRRYGMHYTVVGRLFCPDGRLPLIRTVWIIRNGEDVPRLVTAYPTEEVA